MGVTEQELLDALAGSGMSDDQYLAVAFAIRSLHRRVEHAEAIVAGVLRHEAGMPSEVVADALDYVAVHLLPSAA